MKGLGSRDLMEYEGVGSLYYELNVNPGEKKTPDPFVLCSFLVPLFFVIFSGDFSSLYFQRVRKYAHPVVIFPVLS